MITSDLRDISCVAADQQANPLAAITTLSHLLALHGTAANERERSQVTVLVERVESWIDAKHPFPTRVLQAELE